MNLHRESGSESDPLLDPVNEIDFRQSLCALEGLGDFAEMNFYSGNLSSYLLSESCTCLQVYVVDSRGKFYDLQ